MPYVVGTQIREVRTWGNVGQTLVRERSEIAGVSTEFTPSVTDRDDAFGRHLITYTPSAAGRHLWEGETSDGIPVTFDWEVVTAAQADPGTAYGWTSARVAKLDLLGAGAVLTASPVVGDRVTLHVGDDYSVALGNELEWSYTGPVDLTGATVTLTITSRTLTGVSAITATCAVANPGTATQTITAELTSEQTATLLQREVTKYRVTYLEGTDDVTLFSGKVTVLVD